MTSDCWIIIPMNGDNVRGYRLDVIGNFEIFDLPNIIPVGPKFTA